MHAPNTDSFLGVAFIWPRESTEPESKEARDWSTSSPGLWKARAQFHSVITQEAGE